MLRYCKKATKFEKNFPFVLILKQVKYFFQIFWPSHNILTLRYKFCYRGTFTISPARSQSTHHWQCWMWGNVLKCWIHWEHTSYIYLRWLQKGWKGFLRGKMHKLFSSSLKMFTEHFLAKKLCMPEKPVNLKKVTS